MYKSIIKPFFFRFGPEWVHHRVMAMLKFLLGIPVVRLLVRKMMVVDDPRLSKQLFGLTFPNPVGMAAGFDKEGKYYNALADLGFGFVEIGTFTPEGQPGNQKPRLFRIPQDEGLINRMGFNNSGAERAIERIRKTQPRCIIGGNIGKNTATPNAEATHDYHKAFETLFPYVDYFVINVSCPNITDLHELQDKDELLKIVETVTNLNQQKSTPKPVLLKISPDLNFKQIDDTLEIVKQTGLNGIIATNTSISRDKLNTVESQIKKIGKGGLSGKPIRERSTEVIRYVSKKTNRSIPIIGVGGIFTPEDAIEKMEAGADLIQVYTGFIYEGPFIAKQINKAILNYINN